MAKFKLEHLLKYSASLETREIIALSTAQKHVNTCANLIADLKGEASIANNNLNEQWKLPAPDISMVKMQHSYLQNLDQQITKAEKKLQELQQVAAEKMAQLLKAKTKVKTIEHLKAKSIAANTKREERDELIMFNEVASNRHIAKQK